MAMPTQNPLTDLAEIWYLKEILGDNFKYLVSHIKSCFKLCQKTFLDQLFSHPARI